MTFGNGNTFNSQMNVNSIINRGTSALLSAQNALNKNNSQGHTLSANTTKVNSNENTQSASRVNADQNRRTRTNFFDVLAKVKPDPLGNNDIGDYLNHMMQAYSLQSTEDLNESIRTMTKEIVQIKEINQQILMSQKGKEVLTNIVTLETENGIPKQIEGYLQMPNINKKPIDILSFSVVDATTEELIQEMNLGKKEAGEKVEFCWQGVNSNTGKPNKAGDYRILATALVQGSKFNLMPVVFQK